MDRQNYNVDEEYDYLDGLEYNDRYLDSREQFLFLPENSYDNEWGTNRDIYSKQNNRNPKQNQRDKIIISNKGIQYPIKKEIILYSQLLNLNSDSLEQCQQNQNVQLKVEVPQFIQLNQKYICILQKFISLSSKKPSSIKLKQISLCKNKFGENNSNYSTKLFIESCIIELSTQEIKELIQICRFLQIQTLLEVIYYYLANQYICPLSHNSAQETLNKYNASPKLSPEQSHKMKQKYYYFFQKFSSQLEEIQEQKIQEKEKKIKRIQQQERMKYKTQQERPFQQNTQGTRI